MLIIKSSVTGYIRRQLWRFFCIDIIVCNEVYGPVLVFGQKFQHNAHCCTDNHMEILVATCCNVFFSARKDQFELYPCAHKQVCNDQANNESRGHYFSNSKDH